jgi:hypothetical protein
MLYRALPSMAKVDPAAVNPRNRPSLGSLISVNAASAMFGAGPRATNGVPTRTFIEAPKSAVFSWALAATASRPLSVSARHR